MPSPEYRPKFQTDYQNFFTGVGNNYTPGQPFNWAGGQLNLDPSRSFATYTGPGGNQVRMTPDNAYQAAQQNPNIMRTWNEAYGNDWYQMPSQPPPPANPGIQLPDPSELKGPESWSGIDPAFKPQLTQWMDRLTGLLNPNAYQGYMDSSFNPAINQADQHWKEASQGMGDLYSSILKTRLQAGLEGLAGRNVIDSSMTRDVMSDEAGRARDAIFDRTQQINTARAGSLGQILSQRAAASSGLPNILSRLAGLTQHSQSTNDIAPYEYYINSLINMLPHLQPEGGTLVSNEIGQGES